MIKLSSILAVTAILAYECTSTEMNRGFLREKSSTYEDGEATFTKKLMSSLTTRHLTPLEVCLPFESSCDDNSSPCCQGGCTTTNTCYCQHNDGMCFKFGKADNFCCSNKCGTNGRCECISEEESCAAGDFCCDGLSCTGGKCVSAGSNDASLLTFEAQINTNRNSGIVNSCQPAGQLCFSAGGEDAFCCSGKCNSNRRCKSDNTGSNDFAINFENESNPTNKPSRKPKPTAKPTRKPRKRKTNAPTARPVTAKPTRNTPEQVNSVITPKISDNGCSSGEVKVTIEIKTDKWGDDTSWFLANINSVDEMIVNVKNGAYVANSVNSVDTCLTAGDYNFTVFDQYGDGVCCAYGDGHVRVLLDGREVLFTKSFKKMLTQILKVGHDPTLGMGERDILYLEAHNTRRKEWHESNGVSYVPLIWSHQLAFESRVWAEKLLVNCSIAGIEHEDNVAEGENLAKNIGNEVSWGQLYPPTKIVGRWVDWEIHRPYPGNAHLTQALWRPSKYMGCGESVKDFRNGKCRVQVCRYSRAGNCDMGRYNATFDKNWLEPMIADTSRCGPDCAPEGCY